MEYNIVFSFIDLEALSGENKSDTLTIFSK